MAQPSNAQRISIPSLGLVNNDQAASTTTNEANTRRSLATSAAALRNILTGTVDSMDEEEDQENGGDPANNGQRRRRRVSPLCICVPATFLTLFIIFAGTLAGAIVSWQQYEKLRLHDAWFVRSCVIDSVRVTLSPNGEKWRAEADVRGFGLENETEIVTAYWGRSGMYYLTEDNARRLIDQLPRSGLRATCWVKYSMPRTVSMIKVVRATLSQENVYLNMAWGSSFFAAVSGFLLLTLAVNFVQRALVLAVTGGERAAAGRDLVEGNTPTKRGVCLSPAQTRWVISEFGDVVEGSTMPDQWSCSICLEECEETQRLRIIVLPCGHRFHSICLKRWLRRGSPRCPLCNFDVQSLFNEDGVPIDSQGNTLISPTATETRTEAVVLDMRYSGNHADHNESRSAIDISSRNNASSTPVSGNAGTGGDDAA